MQERMNQLGEIWQPALHRRLRSHSPILLLPKLGADGRVIRYRMVLGLWVLICDSVLSSEIYLADAKCKAQALT